LLTYRPAATSIATPSKTGSDGLHPFLSFELIRHFKENDNEEKPKQRILLQLCHEFEFHAVNTGNERQMAENGGDRLAFFNVD
jgi:hypothetical protein